MALVRNEKHTRCDLAILHLVPVRLLVRINSFETFTLELLWHEIIKPQLQLMNKAVLKYCSFNLCYQNYVKMISCCQSCPCGCVWYWKNVVGTCTAIFRINECRLASFCVHTGRLPIQVSNPFRNYWRETMFTSSRCVLSPNHSSCLTSQMH
jgi:hypothetical protein